MRTLLIDNYDSYTYNLFQLLAVVNGEEPLVVRNNACSWDKLARERFDNVVLSPGPGRPDILSDFGLCRDAIHRATVPLLGVCLGHQGIGIEMGATLRSSPRIFHGEVSLVRHASDPLFRGIPATFHAVRYHSYVIDADLPSNLSAIAWADNGLVMALRHRELSLWGVQFHPESVSTEHGLQLLANFRDITTGDPPSHSATIRSHAVSIRRKTVGLDGASTTARRTTPTGRRAGPAVRENWTTSRSPLAAHVKRLDTWVDPVAAFRRLARHETDIAFLDSSSANRGDGRFSFVALPGGPLAHTATYDVTSQTLELRYANGSEIRHGQFFDVLEEMVAQHNCEPPAVPFDFTGGYVVVLGYELKAECGSPNRHVSQHPDAFLLFVDRLLVADHATGVAYLVALAEGDGDAPDHWFAQVAAKLLTLPPEPPLSPPPGRSHLEPVRHSIRLGRRTYMEKVEECRDHLAAGNSYELCLTTQISVAEPVDSLDTYLWMRALNPAPFASYVRVGDIAIASSSPERFLRIDRDRMVEAEPIKGTAARGGTVMDDELAAARLASDPKTRAENLMIVDLLRNDLGMVCEFGSVHVPSLMRVETYATVHQLVSTIRGRLRADVGPVSVVRAAFPGGSMTGAPKLRSMEILDRLEGGPRGFYSGAIGYLSACGPVDLAITIRTAVVAGGIAAIGSGGAIVMNSSASAEYDEMRLKADVLLRAIAVARDHPAPTGRDTVVA